MKFYQETTDYGDKIANGVYLFDDAKEKMYAYVAPGTGVVKTFKHPIRISTKGRKFKVVDNTYNYTIPEEFAENPRWEVAGSKGVTYFVEKTNNGLTCTCSGFKFRGDCKHVKEFEMGGLRQAAPNGSSLAKGQVGLVGSVKQISRKRTI
jgi:hypothetical protein